LSTITLESTLQQQWQIASQYRFRTILLVEASSARHQQLQHCLQELAVTQQKQYWCIVNEVSTVSQADSESGFCRAVAEKNYRQQLGSACDFLLFDHALVSADAFAALVSTVRAPGLVIIALPSGFIKNLSRQSLYYQRFYRCLLHGGAIRVTDEQHSALFKGLHCWQSQLPVEFQPLPWRFGAMNEQQQQAIMAAIHVVTGHRNRPLVLTADRGRGKTAALALACVALMQKYDQQPLQIVLTAPTIASEQGFFELIQQQLSAAIVTKKQLCYQQHVIKFMAIDQLIAEKPTVNLVIVDEAAAIPIYLLTQLIQHYSRLIFATTVHGYEGAGRGFLLKFLPLLAKEKPDYRTLSLSEPIRWGSGDPVEAMMFHSCLMNAELPEQQHLTVWGESDALSLIEVSAEQLIADDNLLQVIFAILVTAHYQTSPSDLQLLLDHPHIKLFVLVQGDLAPDTIVAVSMVMQEGVSTLPDAGSLQTLAQLQQGKRRLRDQFLPQSLYCQAGFQQAFNFRYWRVIRIAVLPTLQQQGLGSELLTQLAQHAEQQGIDFVGSSFSANAMLLRFWQKNHFVTVRLGFSCAMASGEHSALVLKALSAEAQTILPQWQQAFYQQLPWWLVDEFRQLPSDLVVQLLLQTPTLANLPFDDNQRQAVRDYLAGYRQYSDCIVALQSAIYWLLAQQTGLIAADDWCIVVARVLQKQSIATVCERYQLSGKKQLMQKIKHLLQEQWQLHG
jgi:tRNA(Met) cytidine acetyltransferase